MQLLELFRHLDVDNPRVEEFVEGLCRCQPERESTPESSSTYTFRSLPSPPELDDARRDNARILGLWMSRGQVKGSQIGFENGHYRRVVLWRME